MSARLNEGRVTEPSSLLARVSAWRRPRFTEPVLLRAVVCAALGGAAIGMGGAPYEAYAIAWLGPLALALALRALADTSGPTKGGGLRRAALVGLACGVAANATTCAWVIDLLVTYGHMPTPLAALVATLLFVAQGLPFMVASSLAWVAHRLWTPLAPSGLPTVELALVPSLVVASSITPMIFPWRIGNSQTGWLALAQLAELGGLPLIDLVLALGSVLLSLVVLGRLSRDARRLVAVGAVVLVSGAAAWGQLRLVQVREARVGLPVLSVGLVQHNFDVPERMQPERWEEQLAISWALSGELDRAGVDVLLWPESSYPWGLTRQQLGADSHDPRSYPFEIGVRAPYERTPRVRVPVVLGTVTRDGEHAYNTVLALDEHRVLGVVDKTRLMPFSERIPFWEWLPFLHGVMRPGMTPGPREGGAIDVAGQRLGILNCYEDLMPEHVWRVMRWQPGLLSNHTNDAWFGPTRAPGLHHFLARMRAIETRRDVVRTVNTGVSGVISASGETLVRTQPFDRTTIRAQVRVSSERTAWVHYGDVTTAACWGVLLALAARALTTRRSAAARTKRPAQGEGEAW